MDPTHGSAKQGYPCARTRLAYASLVPQQLMQRRRLPFGVGTRLTSLEHRPRQQLALALAIIALPSALRGIAVPATYHHIREPYHHQTLPPTPPQPLYPSYSCIACLFYTTHVPGRRSGDRMQKKRGCSSARRCRTARAKCSIAHTHAYPRFIITFASPPA